MPARALTVSPRRAAALLALPAALLACAALAGEPAHPEARLVGILAQINAGKAWIKVRLSEISMFRYPGQDELAVVTFDQDYSSSNLNNRIKKRQYWLKEAGRWRIVYEGAA